MAQEINITLPEEETIESSAIPTEIVLEVGRSAEAIDNVEDRLVKVEEGLSSLVGLVESLRAIPPPTIDYDAIVERVTADLEDEEEIEEDTEGLIVEEIPEVEVTPDVEVEEPKREETGILRTLWRFIY